MMTSTLIIGSDKVALTLAKLLTSVGERVSLVGASTSMKHAIRNMGNEEQFKEKHIDRLVSFYPRLSDVGSNVKAVFATNKDCLSDIRFLGSVPVATTDGDAQWPSHVAVRLYDPVESTMSAKIFVSPETDPTALFSISQLLESVGIHNILQDQPDALEVMMQSSTTKPSMDDIFRTVFTSNTPVDLAQTLKKL